jgi:hypothetical protein
MPHVDDFLMDIGAFDLDLTSPWTSPLHVDTILRGTLLLASLSSTHVACYFTLTSSKRSSHYMSIFLIYFIIICTFPMVLSGKWFLAHGFVTYLRRLLTYKRRSPPPFSFIGESRKKPSCYSSQVLVLFK